MLQCLYATLYTLTTHLRYVYHPFVAPEIRCEGITSKKHCIIYANEHTDLNSKQCVVGIAKYTYVNWETVGLKGLMCYWV